MNSLNVWAIDKDIPLKVLLIEWEHRYGMEKFALNLHEQHFQAIELIAAHNGKLRAYIYTFAQSSERYGIDLKYPLAENNRLGENENQTLEQVMTILQTHFF